MTALSPNSPVVLVTGAAKRLGREIALTLARAGWRVAVHCHRSQTDALHTARDCIALATEHGHAAPAQVFSADLSEARAVRQLMQDVIAHFGQCDAVVNNASLFELDTGASFEAEHLARHLATNTTAPVLLAQSLHRHAQERQASGCVVNLLDQKLWNPNPDFFSYTLSKAALESANTLMAQAFAPVLRVVGVAPGLTLTSPHLSDEDFARLHQLSPLGRSSTAQDVASTVLFALTNASITGTTLLVDGGQHLMRFERDFSLMGSGAGHQKGPA
jgi:NAD(P)-dependent dehydrogenase (short-subunit alcohol dehydrogenase family)